MIHSNSIMLKISHQNQRVTKSSMKPLNFKLYCYPKYLIMLGKKFGFQELVQVTQMDCAW